jgi:hypothetical protein
MLHLVLDMIQPLDAQAVETGWTSAAAAACVAVSQAWPGRV